MWFYPVVSLLLAAAFRFCCDLWSRCARKRAGCSTILDQYRTLADVQAALRRAGLESSDLIIGIDFTKSNTWTGERSFGGRCLHALSCSGRESESESERTQNPYQRAISVIGRTLEAFDDDNLIPAFGFGDRATTDKAVFALGGSGGGGGGGGGGGDLGDATCSGFDDVLLKYEAAARRVVLSGPTSFVPLIDQAVSIVQSTGAYHILLIVADGQVSNRRANVDAIVRASNYALSIVMIGVGDGPWDDMQDFDDMLPSRRFDNFQFVCMDKVLREHSDSDAAFALAALMEIPEQYKAIRKLGLLGRSPGTGSGKGSGACADAENRSRDSTRAEAHGTVPMAVPVEQTAAPAEAVAGTWSASAPPAAGMSVATAPALGQCGVVRRACGSQI